MCIRDSVQAIIGKVSFETEKLVENFKAFNDAIQKAKPATAKGAYITNPVSYTHL